MKSAAGRLRWLAIVAALLRVVFVFAAVQTTRAPAIVADVFFQAASDGDPCDDCDDRSDCHCPPGCPKCPYPASHAAGGPPPLPPWLTSKPSALPHAPEVQPRPHYANGPPLDVVPGSVWRPPRTAC